MSNLSYFDDHLRKITIPLSPHSLLCLFFMRCLFFCFLNSKSNMKDNKWGKVGGASRWRKSKTQGSPSSPQIHQKYIYMWNNSYRTPTKRWQKTSDLPKGKKLPIYLGRAKEKRDKHVNKSKVKKDDAMWWGVTESGGSFLWLGSQWRIFWGSDI